MPAYGVNDPVMIDGNELGSGQSPVQRREPEQLKKV